MPTLNFPTSPALNDTYSFNGKTWVWNGQGWQLQNQGAINSIVIGNSTPAAGTFTTLSATGNITTATTIVGVDGYFTGNIDVLGNINSTNAVVYGNSATFLGDPVSGNNAAYFGVEGYTYLGSNIVIQTTGNANNYSQINFQNINPGTAASTDLVLTADNGNDTAYFVDLGIGSGNYAYEGYGAYYPNDAYLLTIGGNLLLNVTEPTKALRVAVGGTEESDLIMLVNTDGVSVTGNVAVSKNINVTGNFTVQGNLQYVNVEDLQIQDPVILIGGGANGDPLIVNDNQDRGSFLAYYTTGRGNAFVGWKNSTGNMIVASDVEFSANNIIQVNDYGTLQTGKIYNGTANADLGNVNTTRIHSVSGYFSGNVDVVGNLNATVGLVYANSGIFLGDAVTGNGAAYAGVPDFTTLGSNVVMQFGGNVNSYSQINFQNINSGTEASTDYILTADNGDDESNYIDLGIGSSTYAAASFPAYGPNDGYLLLSGGNLLINSANTDSVIKFLVGGSDTTDVIATLSNTQLGVTGNVSATGNIAGTYFIGNGSLLTGITGGGGGGGNVTFSDTAPLSPAIGDVWIVGNTAVQLIYFNDGSSSQWAEMEAYEAFSAPDITNLPGGSLSQIQYNDGAGAFAASPNLTFSGTLLSVVGNILNTGSLVVSENISAVSYNGNVISVIGNITGGNVNTSGNIAAGNVNTVGLSLSGNVLSLINSTANITTTANISGGNLSVSTGTVILGNIVNANANGVGNIGSQSNYFSTVHAQATSAQYADLAELYEADRSYLPGTVMMFGGEQEITIAEENTTAIAGVVSTNPAHLMNAGCPGIAVPIALQGRVPCNVTGQVRKGDLMIAAGNGCAKATDTPKIGQVIGKALQNHNGDTGVIEIAVGRL